MSPEFKTVSVIGLGYVGLPTAALFARRGVEVIGVDVNPQTVDRVNEGKVPIPEPGLDAVVNEAVAAGKLRATLAPQPADAFVVAVPTPIAADRKPDLSHVEAAVRAIATVLVPGNLMVIESTCPVGTTEAACGWLADLRPDLGFPHLAGEDADIRVAHSPERVLPGRVLAELVANDRVVGGVTRRCAERAAALYALVVEGECVLTDAATAELVKLAENAYRDVNIAFANELSLVTERLGVDVWEVVALANRHPRVNILKPGPGVGGHCIAVDPWFIVDSAPDQTALIRAARAVNDAQPRAVARRVLAVAEKIERPTVACLGLAYKADVDDLRESPAIAVVGAIAALLDGRVLVVEPHVDGLPDGLAELPGVALASLDEALAEADIVVLLTDHRQFKELDRARLDGKRIIDTRGVWD